MRLRIVHQRQQHEDFLAELIGREVGMKMPPPLRNGMYAAYSAAFSRMLSDSTPGR